MSGPANAQTAGPSHTGSVKDADASMTPKPASGDPPRAKLKPSAAKPPPKPKTAKPGAKAAPKTPAKAKPKAVAQPKPKPGATAVEEKAATPPAVDSSRTTKMDEKSQLGKEHPVLGPADAARRYVDGLDLEREGDLRGALIAYQEAAEAGNGYAQRKLGDLYGKGTPHLERDYEMSLRWYERARQQGIEIPRPFTFPGVRQ